MDLPWNLALDLWLRYVDGFGAFFSPLSIPSYVTFDVRLAWKPLKNLEVAIVGQNLVESQHLEFVVEQFPFLVEIQRGMYGQITWRF